MSIDMYLEDSQQQAASASSVLQKQIEGYTALESALTNFITNSPQLTGRAYDSAKAYCSQILVPLTKACILLNEAIEDACQVFPSRYISDVASSSLRESDLQAWISQANQQILYYQKLANMESRSLEPNRDWIKDLREQVSQHIELKAKLEEKLRNLLAFHASSPSLFQSIGSLAQTVQEGMRQAKGSWNAELQQFEIPPRSELLWVKQVNASWRNRKTAFERRIDGLTLAELEKKYGGIIKSGAGNQYIGPGYDSRYAGLKMSPAEADYIRQRYQFLKARGDKDLAIKEMEAHLRPQDKADIDQMSLGEMAQKYPYLMNSGSAGGFNFDGKAGEARERYLAIRFNELMAREPIDWRDPSFPEKLANYINQTGINPLTGKKATKSEKEAAQLYSPIKYGSNILAFLTLLGGPKAVGKFTANRAKKAFLKEMADLPHVDLSQKVQDGLVSTEKGQRLLPSKYLSQKEIADHLALFDDGAVKVMSNEAYVGAWDEYDGSIGHPNGHYVLPKSVYDRAVRVSDGNPRILEELLALDNGYLGDKPVAIEINNPKNLRFPSGNEKGAWQGLWEPGGYTQGGLPEAVVDQLQPGDYVKKNIYK